MKSTALGSLRNFGEERPSLFLNTIFARVLSGKVIEYHVSSIVSCDGSTIKVSCLPKHVGARIRSDANHARNQGASGRGVDAQTFDCHPVGRCSARADISVSRITNLTFPGLIAQKSGQYNSVRVSR